MYNKTTLYDIKTGLEIELLRVGTDDRLAKTPHPFPGDKNLDRDFCEDQLEIITPPCDGIDELMSVLKKLQSKAVNGLKNEYLWFCSNPPHFDNEDCIHIARFYGNQSFKSDYRNHLKDRYGKRRMLYSGIHFNISFGDKFFESLGISTVEEKNNLYLKLAKYSSYYGWLLVLLTSASPVCDFSLIDDNSCGSFFDGYASRRQGEKGYWNSFDPVLDYSSIDGYTGSIQAYVDKGILLSPSELYIPVRLKFDDDGTVNHIELRMFDINPLYPDGVNSDDLKFAHLFMAYLAAKPDFEFTYDMQIAALKNHKNAAKFDVDNIEIDGNKIISSALDILENTAGFYKNICDTSSIDFQLKKLKNDERYCKKLKILHSVGFASKMAETSKKYTVNKIKKTEV
jgi:glutamate--cysteine ligase